MFDINYGFKISHLLWLEQIPMCLKLGTHHINLIHPLIIEGDPNKNELSKNMYKIISAITI